MKKKNKLYLLLLLLSSIAVSSCYNSKEVAYFQKSSSVNTTGHDTIVVADKYVPRIQEGDILSIYVNSLSTLASSYFNPYSGEKSGGDLSDGSDSKSTPALTQSSAPGFLVNSSGTIDLPLIGTIKVVGLTTVEARDKIKAALSTYLKEPTVSVRFLNFKISILGEVNKPAVYVVPNERITLPEALSLAGDLTIFGRRDNILIVRDDGGKKEFGTVNLNTRDIYNSKYYFLHPNDLVYVEPGKRKTEQTDRTYLLIPSAISLLSLLVIILKN